MRVNRRWINVTSVTPAGLDQRDVMVRGDRFAGFAAPGEPSGSDWAVTDGDGAILYPGMIDLLQHGMAGHLYSDAAPGAVEAASMFLLSAGCTGFLPSFGCTPTARMREVLAGLGAGCRAAEGARALGVHSEGPCFGLPGAHNPENLGRPGAALAETMLEAAGGRLAAVTVAPELPGAEGFIRALKDAGVSVHLGHSRAAPHDVPRYVAWGIDAVTHILQRHAARPYAGMGSKPLFAARCASWPERRTLPLGLSTSRSEIHCDPPGGSAYRRGLGQLPRRSAGLLEDDAMKIPPAAESITDFEFYPVPSRVRERAGQPRFTNPQTGGGSAARIRLERTPGQRPWATNSASWASSTNT